jgi:5-methylcytosine-specific restriction endonuclease McrA
MIGEAEDCALCGDPLDKSAHYTDPFAPQIDHIVQRSDGGGDDDSNLRVVHRRCNIAWSKTVPAYRLAAVRGALWLQSAGL